MVWPAIYISEELWRFWFLVIATIVIETFTIKAMLNYDYKKSFFASVIGNLVSGFIGTFLMMWVMLAWHLVADNFMPHATFDKLNWVATYVLMCLGSVFIETLTIKLIFKDTIRRLFVPLLIGNMLTYSFIAYTMTQKKESEKENWTENVMYSPTPNTFKLLDSTKLIIFTAKTEINHDKNDSILNSQYNIEILFEKEKPEKFQFDLGILGEKYNGGLEDGRKLLHIDKLTDTIKVVLEQKNPNPDKGWTEPITTDTINFIRRIEKK